MSVEDLTSANGTFLNSERVYSKQPVNPGDLLQIGSLVFSVAFQPTTRDSDATGSESDEKPLKQTKQLEEQDTDSEYILLDILPDEQPRPKPSAKSTDVTLHDANADGNADGFEVILDDPPSLESPDGNDFRNLLSKLDE